MASATYCHSPGWGWESLEGPWAPEPSFTSRPHTLLTLILAGAPVPRAEAAVTELVASTHRQGLGGRGQGLPQPGALGAESLQPPQRRGLGPGSQLLAQAAAPQPGQLRPAHRAVSCPMTPRHRGWAGSPCQLAVIGDLPTELWIPSGRRASSSGCWMWPCALVSAWLPSGTSKPNCPR